jgi:hypothetical protein
VHQASGVGLVSQQLTHHHITHQLLSHLSKPILQMHLPNTPLMAALLAMSIPATLASPVSCSGYLANPSDIAQCADYLTSIGTQACETYGGIATQFCQRGEAEVVGVGTGAVGVKTSSPW